jgi:hypothetical protein
MEEINSRNVDALLENHKDSVMDDKKQALRIKYIKVICELLGLKNSIDVNKIISEDQMSDVWNYYNCLPSKDQMMIKELFNVKGLGDTDKKNKAQCAKKLIGKMWDYWNMLGINSDIKWERDKEKRKRIYSFNIKIGESSDNLYIDFINELSNKLISE